MTEKNDIELFQKQGYLIKKTKNTKALYYLQKKIVEFILTSKPNLKKKK